jgi:hypothetical protein
MVLSAVFGKFAWFIWLVSLVEVPLVSSFFVLLIYDYTQLWKKLAMMLPKRFKLLTNSHVLSFLFFFFSQEPNKGTWSWLFLKRIYVQNLMTRAHGLGQSLVTPLCHLISSRVKRRMGAENGRKLLPGLLDQHLYMVDLQSRRVT